MRTLSLAVAASAAPAIGLSGIAVAQPARERVWVVYQPGARSPW